MRLKDQKLKAVQEFQRLNFRIIAVGYSFNDAAMLTAAEAGILFCPSEKVTKAYPQLPVVHSHAELKQKILEIIGDKGAKRRRTA